MMTGMVVAYITDDRAEIDVDMEMAPNGPEVKP
jgi:hypothetical protein